MNLDTENALYDALGPLPGAADDDEFYEMFKDVDPSKRQEVDNLIQHHLLPEFLSLPRGRQEAALQALLAVRAMSDYEVMRLWQSMLPPFDLVGDRHAFFEQVRYSLSKAIER